MKKILLILTGAIVLITLVISLLLFLYKDDIQRQIDNALAGYIDADVYYDPDSFGLGLFRHFPHPTASLAHFGVVGRNRFAGDTLLSVKHFAVTLDLFSLLGDRIRLKAVDLDHPRLFARILEDGAANYDIVKEDGEETSEDAEGPATGMSVGIDFWSIKRGLIVYEDRSLSFIAALTGVDHKGSGNFSTDEFDMHTSSTVEKVTLEYGGVKYLNGQQVRADITMGMDLKDYVFTFLENEIYLNDLGISFSGSVAMPEEEIRMDLSFATGEADIKSLYSLIPAVYRSGYDDIEASGTLAFGGKVKGIYSESRIPAFDVSMKAGNGMIKYPDLPMPVKDINLDMRVRNEDGVTENTEIDIRTLNFLIGSDPVSARVLIRNLRDYDLKADIKARVDLDNLMKIFPLDSIKLGGVFNLDLQAEGKTDTVRNILPVIDARLSLEHGYFHDGMLPRPVEDLFMQSRVNCATGRLQDLVVSIDTIGMKMGSDRFSARGNISDPEDYRWDIYAKGRLNLEAVSRMMPVEGVRYEGMLTADVATKGRYSDLTAGRYDRIPTSGRLNIANLKYEDDELPQKIMISSAAGSFSPGRITVEHLEGSAGRSDFSLKGSVDRYMHYLFGENEVIKGNMLLKSELLDVNEWMEQTGAAGDEVSGDSLQMEVFEIPGDVDFEFKSDIGRINYDNLVLKGVRGMVTVRDSRLILKPVSFETLGGNITMDGQYDTREPDSVRFSYSLNMKGISIPGAFESFDIVRTFAPMAKVMNGSIFSDFEIKGVMKRDMTPVYETINGSGSIVVKDALVRSAEIIKTFNELTGKQLPDSNLQLNDLSILASMKGGRAYVRPFTLHIDGHDFRISGSIGADGSLDYLVDTEIEAGEKGQQINALLATISGKAADSTDTKLNLKIKVGGTYDSPALSLAGITSADGRSAIQAQVKEEISDRADEVKEEAKSQIMQGLGHVLEGDTAALEQQADSLKNILNSDILDLDSLGQKGEDIKNALQNLFKKKKKDDNQQ